MSQSSSRRDAKDIAKLLSTDKEARLEDMLNSLAVYEEGKVDGKDARIDIVKENPGLLEKLKTKLKTNKDLYGYEKLRDLYLKRKSSSSSSSSGVITTDKLNELDRLQERG